MKHVFSCVQIFVPKHGGYRVAEGCVTELKRSGLGSHWKERMQSFHLKNVTLDNGKTDPNRLSAQRSPQQAKVSTSNTTGHMTQLGFH
jgi:hypothetical protein